MRTALVFRQPVGATFPPAPRLRRGRRSARAKAARSRVFVAATIFTVVLAACGGSKETPAGGQRLRFAVIPKVLDIPVFNYAKIGAERQAKEYGNVDILWNAPTTADQLKQKEILESFITQRVDGIAISSLNGDFLTETINKAIDAIITSVGATNLERRLAGMKDALAKAPGIQIVEVFDINEDTVRCAELIATGTARYPDLAAWLSTGGWPVFTRNATAAIDPAKT